MNDYHDILETLASNEYYQIKKISDKLINDESFLEQIIKVSNPFVFDRFTKMVQYKMDTAKLCEKRNKYLKKVILNDSETLPELWLIEDIISYFFQDNYYNFVINLFQMIRYINHTEKDLVSVNNLKIYNEFNNLNKLSINEKKALFKKYQARDDLMEMFYDDLTKVREASHLELTNSTIKLSKDSNIYYKDMSSKLGIEVYGLDGEEFYGFVRCFPINRSDLSDHYDDVFSKKNQLGYSFSYIGDKNIGTIDYDGKSVALFYDNIDYKNIMYVHHDDMHTKKMIVQNDYLSEKENDILSPANLVANTNNYNEIYIKGDDIKPRALICYNAISINDIAFARKYDLAILLINREKYHQYKSYDDDYDRYKYYL